MVAGGAAAGGLPDLHEGDTILLPEGFALSRYSRILKISDDPARPLEAKVATTDYHEGTRWIALGRLEPAEVPDLFLHGERVYLDGVEMTVSHMPDPHTVAMGGATTYSASELTHARDMPVPVTEVIHETPPGRFAESWYRTRYLDKTYISAFLPPVLSRGRLATLCVLTIDADSGEMTSRTFGSPGDSYFRWMYAHPGEPHGFVKGWLRLGKGSDGTLPEYTEAEREWIEASMESLGLPLPWRTRTLPTAPKQRERRRVPELTRKQIPAEPNRWIVFVQDPNGHGISELCQVEEFEDGWGATGYSGVEATGRTWKKAARAWAVAEQKRRAWQAGRAARLADGTFDYGDLDGQTLADFTTPVQLARLDALRGIYPARWLFPRQDGDRKRAVNLCAGCGGGCVGLRDVLGIELDMVCIDISRDATATARAAGCNAVQADITQLDPTHHCLRDVSVLIATPSCVPFTRAGLQKGHDAENIAIISDVITDAAEAAGNVWRTGGWLNDQWVEPTYAEPIDVDWAKVRAPLAGLSDPRAGLMVEIVIWGLGMASIGAPLDTVLVEQSSALPEELRGAIAVEFEIAGLHAQWTEFDAATAGSPSHRRRAFMLVSGTELDLDQLNTMQPITTFAADAIGRPPGLRVITRGNRRTSGGNGFDLSGRTANAITSKIRNWWLVDENGERHDPFTLEEIAKLVTLPGSHPFAGSRSSAAQQAGDIIAPVAMAAVASVVFRVPLADKLNAYLASLFPQVHGHRAPKPKRKKKGKTPASADDSKTRPRADTKRSKAICERKGRCRQRYAYAYVQADPATRRVHRFITCDCERPASRLGDFEKPGPVLRGPIEKASTRGAEAIAAREHCVLVGTWETVDELTRRAPLEWRPPPPAPAAGWPPPAPNHADTDAEREARRHLDRMDAERYVPKLGWTARLADLVERAADGQLHVDENGGFRHVVAPGRRGRRVSTDPIRLLLGGGFLTHDAEPGPVTATADGQRAIRLIALHPTGLIHDQELATRVSKNRRAHQWMTREDADMRLLPPLPGGIEEQRRHDARARRTDAAGKALAETRQRINQMLDEIDAKDEQEQRGREEKKTRHRQAEEHTAEQERLKYTCTDPAALLGYINRGLAFRGNDDQYGQPTYYITQPSHGIYLDVDAKALSVLTRSGLVWINENKPRTTGRIPAKAEISMSLGPGRALLSVYDAKGTEVSRTMLDGDWAGVDAVDRDMVRTLLQGMGLLVSGAWAGHGQGAFRKAPLEVAPSYIAAALDKAA
ncbi:DNA cytosine methyltransferase [Streptomyces hydrogenans]|uniref:DNA cytosine methyltransferase n=1 Tax=Streptomyces hydrogenans TaxID=1873719 RepID=UPI0037F6BC39